MSFLEIKYGSSNWTPIKTPSVFEVSIQDISSPDSGRTLDGLMHKNKIGEKRTIALAWNNISPNDVATILNKFRASEYFDLKYHDPINANEMVTKTFYIGDVSSPMKSWFVGGKLYSQLSFNVIER